MFSPERPRKDYQAEEVRWERASETSNVLHEEFGLDPYRIAALMRVYYVFLQQGRDLELEEGERIALIMDGLRNDALIDVADVRLTEKQYTVIKGAYESAEEVWEKMVRRMIGLDPTPSDDGPSIYDEV